MNPYLPPFLTQLLLNTGLEYLKLLLARVVTDGSVGVEDTLTVGLITAVLEDIYDMGRYRAGIHKATNMSLK
ncbi:hypothetical protein BABINDRAFT_82143 [Babjeviella inositovora NRRL Y-12698]|uniref:Uncharacterized protein n=1 Tax=Babjeviella inositovora NRRL Y-12698 TaxID=984486 RepID=A0A1E3QZW0_9ASCO|nr:uncharacterized protein BABINDRAFT_82143 [Babjeviella inositovora NRRL Y-12698]ODQ83213.1 hypothetical protein BABINDRAFT_82143 [Babjeviella inositovora NRRL Y-12698]